MIDPCLKYRVFDEETKKYVSEYVFVNHHGEICWIRNGDFYRHKTTVEPCTGVCCRATGNLIYKGDIVRYNYPGATPNVVDWNPKTCRWVVRLIKDVGMTEAASFCDDGILPTDGYVIVGNIHEVKND